MGYEVSTAVKMCIMLFWVVTPCILTDVTTVLEKRIAYVYSTVEGDKFL
jgi:hypothetical protein